MEKFIFRGDRSGVFFGEMLERNGQEVKIGNCLQGRNSFVKNKGLDLNDMYSVKEFLSLVKNDFGWDAIKVLAEYYG